MQIPTRAAEAWQLRAHILAVEVFEMLHDDAIGTLSKEEWRALVEKAVDQADTFPRRRRAKLLDLHVEDECSGAKTLPRLRAFLAAAKLRPQGTVAECDLAAPTACTSPISHEAKFELFAAWFARASLVDSVACGAGRQLVVGWC